MHAHKHTHTHIHTLTHSQQLTCCYPMNPWCTRAHKSRHMQAQIQRNRENMCSAVCVCACALRRRMKRQVGTLRSEHIILPDPSVGDLLPYSFMYEWVYVWAHACMMCTRVCLNTFACAHVQTPVFSMHLFPSVMTVCLPACLSMYINPLVCVIVCV